MNYLGSINMDSFSDIIKGSKLVLVDFFATWCQPCKMMHPVLNELKAQSGDTIRILKVDVDKNESLAMDLRVQSVPTLILYKNGEQVWRQSGALSLQALSQIINQHK